MAGAIFIYSAESLLGPCSHVNIIFDIIFGHKASEPGSPFSLRCQKLPFVLNTFLFCLNQLVLSVDPLGTMMDTSIF